MGAKEDKEKGGEINGRKNRRKKIKMEEIDRPRVTLIKEKQINIARFINK